MGPEVAAAAAIGSLALNAGSSVVKGIGEKQGQDFMAGRDERSAALGRVKAEQTDAQLRDELDTTLANIDVTRAAANADPFSPTALAVKANETRISDTARNTRVASLLQQADEDQASAAYRRHAGNMALLGGVLGAGGKLLSGYSPVKG